jgi:hypothetical protein
MGSRKAIECSAHPCADLIQLIFNAAVLDGPIVTPHPVQDDEPVCLDRAGEEGDEDPARVAVQVEGRDVVAAFRPPAIDGVLDGRLGVLDGGSELLELGLELFDDLGARPPPPDDAELPAENCPLNMTRKTSRPKRLSSGCVYSFIICASDASAAFESRDR